MAVLNSATPPTDFSPQDYQRLIEKYLVLSKENDRLVKAIRSGDQVDINHVRQVLQTDFPLYVRLQDYFSRLRDKDLKSVDQTSFVLDDPALGDVGVPSRSIDLGMDGYPEMQLVSESDPDAMSMFTGTGASASTESPPAVPNQGPFGIRFSDYPPRVISQMLSTHTDVAASSCRWFPSIIPRTLSHCSLVASWRGSFTWAGFEHDSRAKKFMRVPMIGLNATNGKDLCAKRHRYHENPHLNNPLPQMRAYMATEHGPPPIGSQASERYRLTRVDKTLRSHVVSIHASPRQGRG